MLARYARVWAVVCLAGVGICFYASGRGQETVPDQQAAPPAAEPPPVPRGVEVLARGPVHEAFATPTSEPMPTKPVAKQPPKPIEEMPPEEKPEGNVIWMGGYWAWDDDRSDFLWVSGIWRTPPPGKQWVAGYWREEGTSWQWVPGFWSAAEQSQAGAQDAARQDLTYMPAPPAPPEVAPPGEPPNTDSFYVPGCWIWRGDTYAWRAGYWAHVQPGYVWVSSHYRWTPSGYIYIPGYWDLAVARRGVLYAPVVVDPLVVGPGFVYTPAYVVRDTLVIDAMFVRPCSCHYYFGDYYGPVYHDLGYESCVVYSRRHYDSIIVYERWEHRREPNWLSVQIDVCDARHRGLAPCPPRTLVQQNVIVQQNITNVNVNNTVVNRTTVNNNQVLVPSSQLAAAKGVRTVQLDPASRLQARQQAQAIQQVAVQRNQTEVRASGGAPAQPRVASFAVPRPQAVGPRSVSGGANAPITSANAHTAIPAAGSPPVRTNVAGGKPTIPPHPGSVSPAPHLSAATPSGAGTPPGARAPTAPYGPGLSGTSHPAPPPGQPGRPMPPGVVPRPPQRPVPPPSRPEPPKRPPGNNQP